ncbi:MAG: aldo/keto reductase, partial [Gammaproteobacteria bacterium]|nr:aldo/keto reductase [Gammaproteobacteria bacterium]
RDAQYKVIDTCRELGIGFVPFSPLGRAFLTGKISDMQRLEEDDMRQSMPRFVGENFTHNRAMVNQLENIATRNSCTAAQLSLAWLLAQDENFVPIPGTKHVKYVEENAAAAELKISDDDLQLAGSIFANNAVRGERYAQSQMISLDPDE